MSYRFKEVNFAEYLDRIGELMFTAGYEVGVEHDDVIVDPNFDVYTSLNEKGIFKVFVAEKEKELIGYCIMSVCEHHQYDNMWAMQDVLYMKPKYRGRASIAFIKYIDAVLEKNKVIVTRVVTKHKDYSKTLEKLGYSKLETIYIKR